MRAVALLVAVLALLAPAALGQVGGQVTNKAPLLQEWGNLAGAASPIGSTDVVFGVVRDSNGEEDLVAIRVENRLASETSSERVIVASDLAATTEPAAFEGGWKVWNPTPDDGRLSFQYEVTYASAQVARWGSSVRDEGDWVRNATVLEVDVPVVGSADPDGALLATLPPPAASVPLPVRFPDDAALAGLTLSFDAPPADSVQVRAEILGSPPTGVPAPPTSGGPFLFFDLSLSATGAPGTPVQPTEATIRFRVASAWLDANCVAPCVVNLFHYSSAARWDAYPATLVGPEGLNRVYEATVTSFSPFGVGGVRPAPAGGGGGGSAPLPATTSAASPPATPASTPGDPGGGPQPSEDGTGPVVGVGQDVGSGEGTAPGGQRSLAMLVIVPIVFLIVVGLGLSRGVRTRVGGGLQGAAAALRRRAMRRQTTRRIPPAPAPPTPRRSTHDAPRPAVTAPAVEPMPAAAPPPPSPPPAVPVVPPAPSAPPPQTFPLVEETPRTPRITDLAQEQWNDVDIRAAKQAPAPVPAIDPAPAVDAPNVSRSRDLDEATRRLAEAIDASWDNVEIVTPRRIRDGPDAREKRDDEPPQH